MKNGLKIICYSQFLQPTYFCCGTTWRASSSRTFQEICHHRYQKQFATVSSLMPPQVASGRYCLERWFNYEIFAAPRRRWALGPGGAHGALCACSGSRDSVIIERKENATPSHKSIQEEKNHWSHCFFSTARCSSSRNSLRGIHPSIHPVDILVAVLPPALMVFFVTRDV